MGQTRDAHGTRGDRTTDLPSEDLADAPTAALLGFIAHFAHNRDTLRAVCGRLTAEVLSRHELTIRQVEDETGVPRSTLDRWAKPFKAGAR